MPTYYPLKDAEYVAWLANFLTVANANLVALGLIADDLSPITSLQPTYSSNLNDIEAKKNAFKASIEVKDATKDSIIKKVRVVVNKIQANPAVTPALKESLGISTKEGGQYPVNPNYPNDLIAELQGNGSVKLDWKRNGNAPNTQFIVEYSGFPSGAWTLLDIVTKTKYIHENAPIGNQIQYWIKARRNNITSGPSNIAFINIV